VQSLIDAEQAVQHAQTSYAAAESGLAKAELDRAELMAAEAGSRDRQRLAEERHTQAQIELARLTERGDDLRRRIEDDFNLVSEMEQPVARAIERLQPQPELPTGLEDQVGQLRRQLRNMGSINPAARSEFEEVKARHDFLSSQVEDLTEAELRLKQVITELDELMAREFEQTFEQVQQAFEQNFVRLFDGGSAKLNLIEVEDQIGIEMDIRLPGKRTQGLSMLSGGERSLTAVSLVFALLKLSPTPFCLLDEVDAMLDESNVLRFVEILRELSQETQFLVITHNRQTIQAAEVLYGISLGNDNASEVISLKLDEASERLAA
jgi:chromosome segregation protein